MARFVLIKEVCPSGWLLWTVRKDGSWDERLTDYCRLILRGFPQLREVVYFNVEQESCLDFATVRPFMVIRTPNLRTP
jgi:hypothetical protein